MTARHYTDRWVLHSRPRPGAKLRLFCLPFAGGGASIYRSWPDRLPVEVQVCAIQLPGRESRLKEQPFTRLDLLIEELGQVLPDLFDLPFAFFGHSLGGLISFELTRWLRRSGLTLPVHLFVSGRFAPQVPDREPPIHTLPAPDFIDALRALEGTPEEVLRHTELLKLIMPFLRADFAISETYVYRSEPPLDCPITVFGGANDTRVCQEDLAAWARQTRGSFALQILPGDHFFIRSAQAELLQLISDELLRFLHVSSL